MTFEEILGQALALLKRRKRVTYNTLRLQFQLDDEQLSALKDELLYSQPHVVDDAGRGLVWTDDTDMTPDLSPSPPPPVPAASPQGQTAQIASPPVAPRSADAERRQLTVMFCDLVEPTALASQLDPEDLREVVRAYQTTCAEVIQQCDGHIAQYLGDGLLVYVGYPQAHEDDAQRAVRTGLGIVEAMATLNSRLEQGQGVRLGVRAGIHTIAQQRPETVFLLRACATGGQAFWYRGDFATAQRTFEQGFAVYDMQRHSPQVLGTWQDPGVTCLGFAALTLWLQGYPDQARARSHHARTLSDALSHPFTKMWATYYGAWLHRFLQESPQEHEHAEKIRALENVHGFTQFSASRTMIQGWALLTQGHAAEGMVQLRAGLEAYRARGTDLLLPYFLARLAEAYHLQGRGEDGLPVVAEALTLVDTNDERWWEAELHRLKGELLQQQDVPDTFQAESCFQYALDVARHQQAKSLELRAAMSLARLWQQQGKGAAAQALLAPIYGWFTEGFDTADLQEARALLEALT